MDWTKVKSAIGTIAPWIAGTLGSPVAGVAVKGLCSVLGLDGNTATPDTITAALAGATPEQLLALKVADQKHQELMQQIGYTHVEQLAASDAATVTAVNQTMQSEAANAAAENGWQKGWRPFNGYVVGLASFVAVLAVFWLLYEGIQNHDAAAIGSIPAVALAVASILAIPGAAVGITAWHRGVAQVEQVKNQGADQ